jgi:hypothetical protein
METRKFRIADLYPFEPGAVRSSYDYHLQRYQNDEDVAPPVVLQLGDDLWMVIQGNNRTKAAKDAGRQEMEFEIGFRDKKDPFHNTLKIRRDKGQKGFENFPIFNNDTDRTAATKKELPFLS